MILLLDGAKLVIIIEQLLWLWRALLIHTHWMYQYCGFGLMMAEWAETCRRIFNFLILITNICCVIDEINLLYYRKKNNGMAPIKKKISWQNLQAS